MRGIADPNKSGVVYIIECLINKRKYIGQSICYKHRYSYHKKLLFLGKHFNSRLQTDYNKYGESNFKFYIIEYCENKTILIKRETYWINYYGGINSDLIYNYHDNKKCDKEMKSKISSGEQHYVLSTNGERYKGENNPMYRKTSY